MRHIVAISGLMVLAFLAGCSSESAKRTAYETLQNVHEQQCLKNPSQDCGKRETYDQYQKQRKELDQAN